METPLQTLTREELIELVAAREQEHQSHLRLITTQEQQLVFKNENILSYEARVIDLEQTIASQSKEILAQQALTAHQKFQLDDLFDAVCTGVFR